MEGVYTYPSHISQTLHMMLGERYSNGSVLGILSQPVNRSSRYYVNVIDHKDDPVPFTGQLIGAGEEIAESLISAAHYFLPAHYVGKNYHRNAGILPPSRVSLHWGELKGYDLLGRSSAAVEDLLIDAGFGFPEAQVWLAHMYSFGKDGFPLNETLARLLYEKAAAAGNTEALYTMGVYYATGTGGVPQNASIAHLYFLKAAYNSPFFPHAQSFHALGNHFSGMHGNPQDFNVSQSLSYYRKAAALNCSSGHYSYAAMLMRNEDGGNGDAGDVSKIIYHYGRAMELGSIAAMATLAIGLFDPDSWLGEFYRDAILHNKSFNRSVPNYSDKYPFRYSVNGSMQFRIYDSEDRISFEYPYPPSHRDGLKIMGYMSEMVHRVKQLKTLGIDAYFYSDYPSALEYLEEAADLGVKSAQMNAVHILEKLRKSAICYGAYALEFPKAGNCTRDMDIRILRRLLQLSNSGERTAQRKLAEILMRGSDLIKRNISLACRLCANAAEAGDTVSIVSLGWITFLGTESIVKNTTLAKSLFIDAFLRELSDAKDNLYSTYGVAPLLSYGYALITELLSTFPFDLDCIVLDLEICVLVILVMAASAILYILFGVKLKKIKSD